MSREAFEKWADSFNPMMAGILKENRCFYETYECGMQARQPEIDAIKDELSLCYGTLESRDRNIETLKAEVERLRKLYDDAMCDCPKHQMKESS